MSKSRTDLHWNERALAEQDKSAVNIADVTQRELETEFLCRHIYAKDNVLEVGCGNGYLTNILRKQAVYVDAFDYAENMVEQAKTLQAEQNNRFFHDNLLAPVNWKSSYDVIVCVRVLINLRNFEDQCLAIKNMANVLPSGGRLLLLEGYSEGFDSLNQLRTSIGLFPLSPASINYYSPLKDMVSFLSTMFTIKDSFHTGSFDFLTRVVYPCLVGSENASGHSDFHRKILPLAQNYNPNEFEQFARLHGFLLEKM